MFKSLAYQDFDRAYRRAFWRKIRAWLTGMSDELLPYDEVRRQLPFSGQRDLGMQTILLEKIVGSVGRYRDLTASFCPRSGERHPNPSLLSGHRTAAGCPLGRRRHFLVRQRLHRQGRPPGHPQTAPGHLDRRHTAGTGARSFPGIHQNQGCSPRCRDHPQLAGQIRQFEASFQEEAE